MNSGLLQDCLLAGEGVFKDSTLATICFFKRCASSVQAVFKRVGLAFSKVGNTEESGSLAFRKHGPAQGHTCDLGRQLSAYALPILLGHRPVLCPCSNPTVSLLQQVLYMATTGVLVTPHGAGMISSLLLPIGAVALEVFLLPQHLPNCEWAKYLQLSGVQTLIFCDNKEQLCQAANPYAPYPRSSGSVRSDKLKELMETALHMLNNFSIENATATAEPSPEVVDHTLKEGSGAGGSKAQSGNQAGGGEDAFSTSIPGVKEADIDEA